MDHAKESRDLLREAERITPRDSVMALALLDYVRREYMDPSKLGDCRRAVDMIRGLVE